MTGEASDRRWFFASLGRIMLGGVALTLIPACERMTGKLGVAKAPPDDRGMHGPITQDTKALELRPAPSVQALLAPYGDGKTFMRRWAIVHAAHGHDDQIVLVVSDIDTGGQARLEIYRLEPGVHPVAKSAEYGVFVGGAPYDHAKISLHLRQLAQRVADMIRANEGTAVLAWEVPRLSTVQAHHAQIAAHEAAIEAAQGKDQAPTQGRVPALAPASGARAGVMR